MLLQTYLWCAERASVASLVALVGVAVNVALNLLWLPRMGLQGAVLATAAANGVAMLLMLGLSSRYGFRVHRGTLVGLLLPISIPLGPWVVLLTLVAVVAEIIVSDRYLTREEKQEIWTGLGQYLGKLRLPTPRGSRVVSGSGRQDAKQDHYPSNTIAELRAAAPTWDDLWQRSDCTSPLAQAGPIADWLAHFAPADRFRALVVADAGRWLAALPLVERRMAGVLRAGALPCNAWPSARRCFGMPRRPMTQSPARRFPAARHNCRGRWCFSKRPCPPGHRGRPWSAR